MTTYSAPEAFTPALKEKLLELPVENDQDEVLTILVRRIPLSDLQLALQALPDLAPQPGSDEALVNPGHFERLADQCKGLARLGIVGPPFSFDEREEGKAFWGDLHEMNQITIGLEILKMSGLGGAGTALATFLREFGGGRRSGGGDHGPVPAAAAAPSTAERAVGDDER